MYYSQQACFMVKYVSLSFACLAYESITTLFIVERHKELLDGID